VNQTDLPPATLFVALAAKHGHYCPMSTLGLRLGWAAGKRLAAPLASASYAAATCAADGIRLGLATELLRVEDQGRHLLSCFDAGGENWRIEISAAAMELAATYRTLDTADEREALLAQLRSADESWLFVISAGSAEP
jgi:formylmethanofuran dehydrogenase subunit E